MYKIDYEKLGIYIGKKATEYFGRFYSKDIADYENEIVNASEIYNEINDYYKCSIELAEVGKAPLIIEYYYRCILDNNGNIIDIIYYIEDLSFNFD